MFSNLTTVSQGCVGLGHAIAYFVSKGLTVSLPLIDNQDYDLVVDQDGLLKKVQVKTVGYKKPNGNYEVQLRAVRPNKTKNAIKKFDGSKVDFLFILVENGDRYVIPCNEISAGSTLTLNESRDKYKITEV